MEILTAEQLVNVCVDAKAEIQRKRLTTLENNQRREYEGLRSLYEQIGNPYTRATNTMYSVLRMSES